MKLCVKACLTISSRANMTFNIACKPNSQWLLPIPLSNRLDWFSSFTIWLWPLKISVNYISSYPDDVYFLLHFAQMQSALKAENAASSHLLWHLSSLIMMALPPLLALTMCSSLLDVFRSLSMHHPGAFPMCSALILTSLLKRRFLSCSQSTWPTWSSCPSSGTSCVTGTWDTTNMNV